MILTNTQIRDITGVSASDDSLTYWQEMALELLASELGVLSFLSHAVEFEKVRVLNPDYLSLSDFPVEVATLDIFEFPTVLRQLKRNYTNHICQGTTSVRDMGAFPLYLRDYLSQIDEGSLIGPRVVFCNSFMNIRGKNPNVHGRKERKDSTGYETRCFRKPNE